MDRNCSWVLHAILLSFLQTHVVLAGNIKLDIPYFENLIPDLTEGLVENPLHEQNTTKE
ncbi:hypothetical protein I3842_16G117900 [Carya illinoinensis]|uniref:Uncharacterized protein n=1 Tax=Carya illinoinensis TaxID=32201 RepID=A0A922A9H8_CARIL|nr:hypothetical protein I3842_16G117900 [Carya illinoinensis]